ncbi:NACHT domain-containing protein [Kribbella amoyensis]|uniref:NACHT domain-containing protein n=1 Tax=Kribbella amoyensis TaxID=996641 RepID=UPI001EE20ECA|nr:NACHT domain-containing protein [Kribbella amoyensis]
MLLPIAINVGTGGTAPDFLARYVDWTWPVIGLLWCAAIVTGVIEYRSRFATTSARSADQPRNRPNALGRVDRYLVERSAGSLRSKLRLALSVEERPEAVRPYDLLVQPLESGSGTVRRGTDVARIFDELQDSMLVLGAPGAGKTTLLMDLARSLLDQANADPSRPVPVLIDLAGWTGPGTAPGRPTDDDPADTAPLAAFVRWLLDECSSRYGIPAPVGRVWLRDGRLALLLDGLDEVAAGQRERLTAILEQLRQNYLVSQLAITSRTKEYEDLARPLGLYGAVQIRPLSRAQVLEYFTAGGDDLAGARAAVERDAELWDMVDSPLMLNVVALAYQGRAAGEVASGAVADHRRELFDTYVIEVLVRHRSGSGQYPSRTVLRSLWCLARWTRMGEGDRIMLPRRLPPGGWYGMVLPEVSRLAHLICLPALFAGFVAGFAMTATLLFGVPAGVAAGAVALVLIQQRGTWRVFREGPPGPVGTIAALIVGGALLTGLALTAIGAGVVAILPTWLATLLVVGGVVAASLREVFLVGGDDRPTKYLVRLRLVMLCVLTGLALARVSTPEVLLEAFLVGLVGAEGVRLIARLPMDQLVARDPSTEWVDGPRFRWAIARWVIPVGVGAVVVAAILSGKLRTGPEPLLGLLLGATASQGWQVVGYRLTETVSRILHGAPLRWTGYLPWRRRAFLRFAADRHLLAPTGQLDRLAGEQYAFIHLLVRDHLADCDPDELAARVNTRLEEREATRTAAVLAD